MNVTPARLGLVAFGLVGLVDIANACSLYRSYEPFVLGPKIRYKAELEPAPEVHIQEIKRGHSGETTACANWGSIVLTVPAGDAGYSFEIIESSIGEVFPSGFVRSSSGYAFPAGLRFYWSDGATDDQELIELLVRITAVSRDGVLSEPTVLKIEHAGVQAAR